MERLEGVEKGNTGYGVCADLHMCSIKTYVSAFAYCIEGTFHPSNHVMSRCEEVLIIVFLIAESTTL